MSFVLYKILLLLFLTKLEGSELGCKNEKGEIVDWFIMYKLPVIQKQTNYLLRKGLAYAFITSEDPSSGWKLSQLSINDTRSLPGQTLESLYKNDSDDKVWLLYNDEPPSVSASSAFGHTKGTVFANQEKGFWMIHSVPKFPIEPVSVLKTDNEVVKKTKNSYFYPANAVKYGQSFLCITMNLEQLNNVGQQLLYYKPKVYSSNLPTLYETSVPNIKLVVNRKYIKSAPWNNKLNITSSSGVNFVSYAKAAQFGKELYSDWLAVDLEDNLNVETWSNGPGNMPSECDKPFFVQDVKQLIINFDKQTKINFKSSQDHSKWAVAVEKNSPWLCIGDINRMVAQLKRGGGTVCFRNQSVWSSFTKVIDEVEACKRNITQH